MQYVVKVISVVLLAIHCSAAFSQDVLTITSSGYYLTVVDASGTPQYTKIETIVDLSGGETPAPDDPSSDSKVDLELVAKTKLWATAIADPQSAQAIAAVYAHIRGAMSDGTLAPKNAIAPLKQATDSALEVIGSGKDWSSFRDKLTAEFTEASQRGNLNTEKQVALVLLSVQHGVELSADGSAAISLDKIVEIARRTNLAIDEATK